MTPHSYLFTASTSYDRRKPTMRRVLVSQRQLGALVSSAIILLPNSWAAAQDANGAGLPRPPIPVVELDATPTAEGVVDAPDAGWAAAGPDAAGASDPTPSTDAPMSPASAIAVGVGSIALFAGLYFLSKEEAEAGHLDAVCSDSVCPRSESDAIATYERDRQLGLWLSLGGLAALGTGIGIYLLTPSRDAQVSVRLGSSGASFAGRF